MIEPAEIASWIVVTNSARLPSEAPGAACAIQVCRPSGSAPQTKPQTTSSTKTPGSDQASSGSETTATASTIFADGEGAGDVAAQRDAGDEVAGDAGDAEREQGDRDVRRRP